MDTKKIIADICEAEQRLRNGRDLTTQEQLEKLRFCELMLYYFHRNFPDQKNPFLYKKAHITDKHFSKILDPDYHPSRPVVIALGLALELDIDEFELLLKSAYYSLSINNTFDLVILYCIAHRIYDIFIVNEILYDMNLL